MIPLFPTYLYQGTLPDAKKLNQKLIKEIQSFSKQDRMGSDWSNVNYRGGYTSYASLSDLHFRSPLFSDFAETLQPFAENFAKKLRWNLRGLQLELNSLWMNIMPEHTYHPLHLHPHCVLSGTYYVSVPKNSVSLKIEDPRMPYYMNAPVRELYHQVVPKEGSFVLFESWLRHEVPPNRSKTPRISLSFNYSLNPDPL